MYVLSTNQTQNQGLERHCRDPGIDRRTVVRDSEKRKFKFLDGIRHLTAAQEARFTKILARDAVLEKKTIFGMETTEVRNAGIPRDCRRKERRCGMRNLFLDPENMAVKKCKGRIRGTQRLLSVKYRKIPKISPGAYIFQRPFLRGLFLEGLIFGGAYLRREICVSKPIGLAL